jgi:hypothetical protein
MVAPRRCAACRARINAGGAGRPSSRHDGTTTICARRIASSPCCTPSVKPALVCNAPGSLAHTRRRKRGAPVSVRSSPNTMQGTERWKGLMPSKATTAMVSASLPAVALRMARCYR